jgi:hypothetical protein
MPHDNATAEKAVRPKLSPKDAARALLDRLPDDVTLEDIQYHLDVVVKVLPRPLTPAMTFLTKNL